MKILITAAAAAIGYKLTNIKAHAWFGDTHKDIIKKALELLKKENKTKAYSFFEGYEKELIKGSTAPDRAKDIEHGSGMHYYSCCKPHGKELPNINGYYKNRHGKFLPSARTLMEQNYSSAVSLYKSGMIKESMTCFARAAHFVSDMGCTVHTANIRCFNRRGNIHNSYEEHANVNYKGCSAENMDKRLNKYYEKENFQDALNKLIGFSSKYVKQVRTLDPKAFDDAEKNTLVYTQQNVAALMIRFFNDCTKENNKYLSQDRNYIIKNLKTGLLVTVTTKGLIMAESDSELDQRLRIEWNNKGYFCFVTTDSLYISNDLKRLIDKDSNTSHALFRTIYLGKDKYILTVGEKNFKRVLSCSDSGRIRTEKFDPRRSSQIWTIN